MNKFLLILFFVMFVNTSLLSEDNFENGFDVKIDHNQWTVNLF